MLFRATQSCPAPPAIPFCLLCFALLAMLQTASSAEGVVARTSADGHVTPALLARLCPATDTYLCNAASSIVMLPCLLCCAVPRRAAQHRRPPHFACFCLLAMLCYRRRARAVGDGRENLRRRARHACSARAPVPCYRHLRVPRCELDRDAPLPTMLGRATHSCPAPPAIPFCLLCFALLAMLQTASPGRGGRARGTSLKFLGFANTSVFPDSCCV